MDWAQSASQSFSLYNRRDDKGKKVYQPTVFQMGFQRTDVALMSPSKCKNYIEINKILRGIKWNSVESTRRMKVFSWFWCLSPI